MFLKLSKFLDGVGYGLAFDFLVKSAGYDDEWHSKINEMSKDNPKTFDKFFGGEDRIYIPMSTKLDINIEPLDSLLDVIGESNKIFPELNIQIDSYLNGIITINGRSFKVMKFLDRLPRLLKDKGIDISTTSLDLDLAKREFANDKRRQFKNDELLAVISQNPHDLAKMSTERAWRSCMTLPVSKEEGGKHHLNVFCEVRDGGFVGYAIVKSDKEIKNPIARVHIRKFTNGNEFIAIPEFTTYTEKHKNKNVASELLDIVKKFCKTINDSRSIGTYNLVGGAYSDTFKFKDYNHIDHEQVIEVLKTEDKDSAEYLNVARRVHQYSLSLESLNYEQLVNLVDVNPRCISLIPYNKLTDDLKLLAVSKNGYLIEDIENPSEEMCLAAVKQDPLSIEFIEKPTENVRLAAVMQDGKALEYVIDKTPEICLAAVKNDSWALQYVETEKQTHQMCMEAVKKRGMVLYYVHKQTPEICVEAVLNNKDAIRYVDPEIIRKFPIIKQLANR